MRRYLLDTGIMGHFINRRRGVDVRVEESRRRGDRIVTCLPVVAELFAGVERSQSREPNRRRLVLALERVPAWPLDRAAAEEFGRIDAALRALGRPIGKVDMQIAAIALVMGNTTVVSADNDLKVVPGLPSRIGRRRRHRSAVPFEVELKAGKTRLQTWLIEKNGESHGAYFVEVKYRE
jgi:tRNA(fMet)-specific endonuclease VapC